MAVRPEKQHRAKDAETRGSGGTITFIMNYFLMNAEI